MERILQWILKLEEQLDREDKIATNDLKLVKEQFQKHEVEKAQLFNSFYFYFFLNRLL
jgi:hypothetical protein